MTEKIVKNEQWYVSDLVSKIKQKKIKKPKFQRKKKWDIKNKSKNPNEKEFIDFLFETQNSVHPITFGQETINNTIIYSNIDGNNRINAIQHFMESPFEIFDEHLKNLFLLLDNNIENPFKDEIKNIFQITSYNQFISIQRTDRFFNKINKPELVDITKDLNYELDDEIERIQSKLKINSEKNFDSNVKISVNIFEGYDTDQLCNIFASINKHNSTLTETEMLASQLYNEDSFNIEDNVLKTNLENSIKEHYQEKSKGEALECYNYNSSHKINAYDFIIGMQNMLNKQYSFIDKPEIHNISLFFKLFKTLNGGYAGKFTNTNVKCFIDNIEYSCNIMDKSIKNIFPEKINNKLFNKSCQEKSNSIKKNNAFLLLSSIIGYKKKNIDEKNIIKSIEKCLLFHFLVSDLKNKDSKEDYKNIDSITYRAGGTYTENVAKNLFIDPDIISAKLTPAIFRKILYELCDENNNPYQRKLENGNNKNEKRRNLIFFEKTLMFYLYKQNIPHNMLDNDFSIEHIFPNSSDWDGEIDKDRTGNLTPIIASLNSGRGNKHISYYKNDSSKDFFYYMKDIIPSEEKYNKTIIHKDNNKKPKIIDNNSYNEICKKNEKTYIESFIKSIFNENLI